MTGEIRVVHPQDVLRSLEASRATNRLADTLSRQASPGGTPYSKTRLGYVTAFDPSTWTVTALIGDLLTPIPGIAALGEVLPAVEAPGMFLQTGGDGTTEYTLIGMLPKDSGTPTYGQTWRLRTQADQTIANSGPTVGADAYLKFYGQAGRTYIFDLCLIVAQSSPTNTIDFVLDWILPSGATWSGGGPRTSLSIATGTGSDSTGASANWRAYSNETNPIAYGIEGSSTLGLFDRPDAVMLKGTVKMGATSGLCSVGWAQNSPQAVSTRVEEGSYLKVDMTSEYTL
jgi:hypothetical protein